MKSFSMQKLLRRHKTGRKWFFPQMCFSPLCRWEILHQGMEEGVLKKRGGEVHSSRLFHCFPELQRDQGKWDINWLV